MKPRGKDFTLVELLVVVAVIALLAGLLLPALRAARERGKTVACISNQKQCGLAMQLYAGDYNLWLPVCWNDSSPGTENTLWASSLYNNNYLPNWNSFVCQSFPPYGAIKENPSRTAYLCYAMIGAYNYNFRLNLAKLWSPSDSEILADSITTVPPSWVLADHGIEGPVQVSWTQKLHFGNPLGIHMRHHGRANILFSDGHAEGCDKNTKIPKELYFPQFGKLPLFSCYDLFF